MGVTLAGNSRAGNDANVRDAVRFGRGMMPAFMAELEPDAIDAVVAYVTQVLSQNQANR
jgi:mono/diheme cytochrome c family protein